MSFDRSTTLAQEANESDDKRMSSHPSYLRFSLLRNVPCPLKRWKRRRINWRGEDSMIAAKDNTWGASPSPPGSPKLARYTVRCRTSILAAIAHVLFRRGPLSPSSQCTTPPPKSYDEISYLLCARCRGRLSYLDAYAVRGTVGIICVTLTIRQCFFRITRQTGRLHGRVAPDTPARRS